MTHYLTRFRTALFAALVLASIQAAPAQDTAQEEKPQPQPFMRRFSIGGRLTVLGLNSMNSGEMTRSTSEPAVTVKTTASPESKRAGGGVTLEFAVTRQFSLGADLLYKRAGYNRTLVRTEGVDDSSTTAVESSTTKDIENTRADYWDLPILARFYNKAPDEGGARVFLLAGASFRRVSAIHTVREVVRADGLSDTYETPAAPANRTIGGAVIGAGFQVSDEIRFKFTPEFRFTRWLRSTFDNAPVRSPKNQVEIVFGLTF